MILSDPRKVTSICANFHVFQVGMMPCWFVVGVVVF